MCYKIMSQNLQKFIKNDIILDIIIIVFMLELDKNY